MKNFTLHNYIAARRKKRKGGMIRRTVHPVSTEDVGGNKIQLSNQNSN